MRRGATELVWPAALLRPVDAVLTYLDLNHWVALAKAAVGHRDGRHAPALEALRALRATGAVIPLSATHVMEMAAIGSRRQRRDVTSVMEELSGFDVLVSRAVVQELELEAVLDAFGRPRDVPFTSVPILGRGVLTAFGRVGGLRVRQRETGEDVTEEVRASWPEGPTAFDAFQEEAERSLDRAVLAGPQDDEEERELRVDGWDPMRALKMIDDNAAFEIELSNRLDQNLHWRRQRVRDVVSARHLAFELLEKLQAGLAARGLELEDVCGDPESARKLVDAMPTADVCVSLKAAAHRNPQTIWTHNRLYDIDALSVAVPYCDFVATDREALHALESEGVPQRMRTTVVATLDELVEAMTR